jgi:hypothetical protein
MKQGPIHLILDPNHRLECVECHKMLFNTVAFIRGRTVTDTQGHTKYRVGVVLCCDCEPKTRDSERSAQVDY